MKSKILIISWSDFFGGAAKSSYNLFKLLKKNFNVSFFVQKKLTKDISVKTYKKTTFNLLLRRSFSFVINKIRGSNNDLSHNLLESDILKEAECEKYDLINFHWIGGETLSINQITNLKKKIILTLHDMWLMVGASHYLYNHPNKFFFKGEKLKISFFDKIVWSKKLSLNGEIYIVTPSNWLKNLVKRSRLLNKFPVTVIPYSTNHNIFRPHLVKLNSINKEYRPHFKKKITKILFVSAARLNDYRKGFDLLDKALRSNKIKNYKLFIVGKIKEKEKENINSNFVHLGEVYNQKLLSMYYNLCDLLVIPSRLDNLPNVGIEAHSCGKPVVSFKVGGLQDIITHKKTGYLAKPYSITDFVNGINYTIKNKKKLSINSLIKSKIWSEKNINKQYNKFFKNIKS